MIKSSILLAVVLVCFAGCGNKQPQDPVLDKPLAKVNDYTITVRDFNQDTSHWSPVFRSISSVSARKVKQEILDEMINNQVLLQEAQKMNLDKEKDFMKQVENFWRLSLIKQLWDYKTKEVYAHVQVSDAEVATEYARISKGRKDAPPLKEIAEHIKDSLVRRKVQDAMQVWMDNLKKSSSITVDRNILDTLTIAGGKEGNHE